MKKIWKASKFEQRGLSILICSRVKHIQTNDFIKSIPYLFQDIDSDVDEEVSSNNADDNNYYDKHVAIVRKSITTLKTRIRWRKQ